MKAPDKIYMDIHQSYVTYSIVPIPDFGGTEYLRKDKLLELVKELKEHWDKSPKTAMDKGCVYMLKYIIDKLNSM